MEQTSLRGARWLKTLEQHKLEFTTEAKRLQSIDGKVVNNRSALGQLQTQIVASFSEQCRISRQLDILDSHQQEMDAALMSLIADLERIQSTFVSTSNERELLFSFSEDISSKLLGINQLFPRSHVGTKSLSATASLSSTFDNLQLQLRELQRLERELNVL